MTDVVVTDELPAGLRVVDVAGEGCEVEDGVVSCAVGTLTQGARTSVVVTAVVADDATGTITNVGTVTGAGLDPVSSAADVTVATPSAGPLPGTGAAVRALARGRRRAAARRGRPADGTPPPRRLSRRPGRAGHDPVSDRPTKRPRHTG